MKQSIIDKVVFPGWMILIATNLARTLSETRPIEGTVILTGIVYLLILHTSAVVALWRAPIARTFALAMVVPVLLMAWSTEPFERSEYTTSIACALILIGGIVMQTRFSSWDAIVTVVGAVGIALTFSRAGIVVAALLVLLCCVYRWRSYGATRAGIGIGAALAGMALIGIIREAQQVSLSAEAYSRLLLFSNFEYKDESYTQRSVGFEDSMALIGARMWTGAGPWTTLRATVGPHNMFLAVAADYGILGVTLYAGIIIAVIRKVMRAKKFYLGSRRGMLAIITCAWLVATSMVSHNVLTEPPTLLMIGLMLGWLYQDENEPAKASEQAPLSPLPFSVQ
jgi:hypothetical protein